MLELAELHHQARERLRAQHDLHGARSVQARVVELCFRQGLGGVLHRLFVRLSVCAGQSVRGETRDRAVDRLRHPHRKVGNLDRVVDLGVAHFGNRRQVVLHRDVEQVTVQQLAEQLVLVGALGVLLRPVELAAPAVLDAFARVGRADHVLRVGEGFSQCARCLGKPVSRPQPRGGDHRHLRHVGQQERGRKTQVRKVAHLQHPVDARVFLPLQSQRCALVQLVANHSQGLVSAPFCAHLYQRLGQLVRVFQARDVVGARQR